VGPRDGLETVEKKISCTNVNRNRTVQPVAISTLSRHKLSYPTEGVNTDAHVQISDLIRMLLKHVNVSWRTDELWSQSAKASCLERKWEHVRIY
jgi:hypothetical protein